MYVFKVKALCAKEAYYYYYFLQQDLIQVHASNSRYAQHTSTEHIFKERYHAGPFPLGRAFWEFSQWSVPSENHLHFAPIPKLPATATRNTHYSQLSSIFKYYCWTTNALRAERRVKHVPDAPCPGNQSRARRALLKSSV